LFLDPEPVFAHIRKRLADIAAVTAGQAHGCAAKAIGIARSTEYSWKKRRHRLQREVG
jgi:hypothetical protein